MRIAILLTREKQISTCLTDGKILLTRGALRLILNIGTSRPAAAGLRRSSPAQSGSP
jgi:hypothetical protein